MFIEDEPACTWRGFLPDVARHFTPKSELLQLICELALHRVNHLRLHLSDDTGYRVESRAFPRLTEIATWRAETPIGTAPFDGSEPPMDGTPHGGYYTLDDLREITAYAQLHGITIVPELDLPGHASALLAVVPELTVPGVPVPSAPATSILPSGRVVSPLPEARAVLASLLEEIADTVDSPYLHIGGDEADLSDWERSADVRAYAKGRGLDSVEELRADLTTYLVDVCTRLGRRAVVWEEAARTGGLRPDTVVMVWRAERNAHPVLAVGHDVVMAPIVGNDAEERFPGRILETQAGLWTEFVPDRRARSYRTWPRLAAHAANNWRGTPTEWPRQQPELEEHLARLDAAGIEYRPLAGPRLWQQGGTGTRRNTSPLSVDTVLQLMEQKADNADAPDLERLKKLLDHVQGNQQDQ
ncbi:family 20 glycosylhydrolase [Streptomyces sp. NPDC088141]|uniref:family 20 glycosylhydrolase n=1 Tax=Streptomyces sp. NPDC088141 TaxID=3155179 RepID=UPI00341B39E4